MKTNCGSSPESLTRPTENLFTKEQVEELLKKQREICAEKSLSLEKKANQKATMIYYTILNAPSPLERGEK